MFYFLFFESFYLLSFKFELTDWLFSLFEDFDAFESTILRRFDFLTNPCEDKCFLNAESFIFYAKLFWNKVELGFAQDFGGECACPIFYNKINTAEFLSINILIVWCFIKNHGTKLGFWAQKKNIDWFSIIELKNFKTKRQFIESFNHFVYKNLRSLRKTFFEFRTWLVT